MVNDTLTVRRLKAQRNLTRDEYRFVAWQNAFPREVTPQCFAFDVLHRNVDRFAISIDVVHPPHIFMSHLAGEHQLAFRHRFAGGPSLESNDLVRFAVPGSVNNPGASAP